MLLRQLVRIYFQGGSEWESKKRDSNLQKVVSLEIETEKLKKKQTKNTKLPKIEVKIKSR